MALWYHWAMQDHRIRLDDWEIELICAALRARLAGYSGERARAVQRLLDRLEDGGVGNPRWRFENQFPF